MVYLFPSAVVMLEVESLFPLLFVLSWTILSVFILPNPELKRVLFDEHNNADLIKDGDDDGDLDDGDDEQEANEIRESDAARVMEFNEELSISFR